MFNFFYKKDSLVINNKIVQQYIDNPDFPWLISFPRTGSHWLRMLMELYFKKPSLVRTFFYHKAKDFTCYHRHDEDLKIENVNNIIYLYRNPIDTVYSQMNYYNEDLMNNDRIIYWAELYGMHLSKWLYDETFSQKKVVLTYEGLKNNLVKEFEKLCEFFEHEFIENKIIKINEMVSKEKLKKKTKHDQQVVNLSNEYQIVRQKFTYQNKEKIYNSVFNKNSKLENIFNAS